MRSDTQRVYAAVIIIISYQHLCHYHSQLRDFSRSQEFIIGNDPPSISFGLFSERKHLFWSKRCPYQTSCHHHDSIIILDLINPNTRECACSIKQHCSIVIVTSKKLILPSLIITPQNFQSQLSHCHCFHYHCYCHEK